MLKVKAGNLQLLGLLFERHHRRLYGFLFHVTFHKETAEDLVQQVFYRVLKYRERFTGEGGFVNWMFATRSVTVGFSYNFGTTIKNQRKHDTTGADAEASRVKN